MFRSEKPTNTKPSDHVSKQNPNPPPPGVVGIGTQVPSSPAALRDIRSRLGPANTVLYCSERCPGTRKKSSEAARGIGAFSRQLLALSLYTTSIGLPQLCHQLLVNNICFNLLFTSCSGPQPCSMVSAAVASTR